MFRNNNEGDWGGFLSRWSSTADLDTSRMSRNDNEGDWDGVLRRWRATADIDTSRMSQNNNEGGGHDLFLVDFHLYLFSLGH